MVDVSLLRPGIRVKVKGNNGVPDEVGAIRGSYMTSDGIAFTVKTNPGSPVDRNVPLSDILEIVQEA